MLGKLFISAQERGISQEDLRDHIAYELIGKRLSAASEKEIGIVLEHIVGPMKWRNREGAKDAKKYESSIGGLRAEVCDLARERFGESWELPLNNFCRRFGMAKWQWLDVEHGKAVKQALMRLQAGKPEN